MPFLAPAVPALTAIGTGLGAAGTIYSMANRPNAPGAPAIQGGAGINLPTPPPIRTAPPPQQIQPNIAQFLQGMQGGFGG